MSRNNNTIKSLKQNLQKMRSEVAQNKQSLALLLNRAVVAEHNTKPLVHELTLATKQSSGTKNNIQHYEIKLK